MLLQMISECSFNKHIIIYSSVFLVSSTTAQSSSNNSSSTPSGGDIVTDESPQNFEDSPQKVATVVCSFIAGIIIFLSLKWARLRYLAKLQEEKKSKEDEKKMMKNGSESSIEQPKSALLRFFNK
jgi:hypothetical protein